MLCVSLDSFMTSNKICPARQGNNGQVLTKERQMEPLTERFLEYLQIGSHKQRLACLTEELTALGCTAILTDQYGNLTATLKANNQGEAPTVGLIAVLDSRGDRGPTRHPQLVENYRGGDIALGRGERVLSPVEVPVLHQLHGHGLLTTDGEVPLGVDSNAGLAVLLTALQTLISRPHGPLRLAFLSDVQTREGAFDLQGFGADLSYLLQGSDQWGVMVESVNAAEARIKISSQARAVGQDIAKHNACELAWEFHQALPLKQKSGPLDGQQGFWHLQSMKSSQTRAELHYQLCDVDDQKFVQRQHLLQQIADQMQQRYPQRVSVNVGLRQIGLNMRDQLAAQPLLAALAEEALRQCGISRPLAALNPQPAETMSHLQGLPCPRLFTGAFNAPSNEEFVSLQVMAQSVEVVIALATLAMGQSSVTRVV